MQYFILLIRIQNWYPCLKRVSILRGGGRKALKQALSESHLNNPNHFRVNLITHFYRNEFF